MRQATSTSTKRSRGVASSDDFYCTAPKMSGRVKGTKGSIENYRASNNALLMETIVHTLLGCVPLPAAPPFQCCAVDGCCALRAADFFSCAGAAQAAYHSSQHWKGGRGTPGRSGRRRTHLNAAESEEKRFFEMDFQHSVHDGDTRQTDFHMVMTVRRHWK